MNFITSSVAFSLYPRASIGESLNLVTQNPKTRTIDSPELLKYIDRGFNLSRGENNVKNVYRGFCLGYRNLGDRRTCAVPLDTDDLSLEVPDHARRCCDSDGFNPYLPYSWKLNRKLEHQTMSHTDDFNIRRRNLPFKRIPRLENWSTTSRLLMRAIKNNKKSIKSPH
jgi:hypothetical protein